MALNIDNLIIDRALSGSMIDRSTGEALYSLNQIADPSLECTGEQVYVTDAVGVRVAAFDRSKEATLSGTNAFFNLGLAATQFGTKKKTAGTGEDAIIVPVRETHQATSGAARTITLSAVPVAGETLSVNLATRDGGITKTLTEIDQMSSQDATVDNFSRGVTTVDGKQVGLLTLHTDIPAGQDVIVLYRKRSESAIQINNQADAFTKGGEFWLEVLFCDICDTNTKYHGFLVFPNGKMTNETTIDFNNEATHGFTIEAMQDYCDVDKKLFYIVVSE